MKFTLTQTMAQDSSRKGARGFAFALVILILLACAGTARAQETTAPPAPQTPAVNATPKPARPGVQRTPVAAPAARVLRPAAAATTAPQAGVQASTQTPKAAPAIAPLPPRQVVTVVHRLSGWKLLAMLATRDQSSLEIEELPSPTDVHTNIVAGYISDDGRTVVAHLPQTESDLDSFPEPPANLFAMTTPQPAQTAQPEYTLITSDGRSVEAKFVGLDAATGLTLLEASSSLMSNAPVGIEGNTEDPSVGQRVRFYLPALAPPAAARAAAATPPVPGYIYVNIDEKEGRLTEVKSWPSGRPFRLVARTPAASPDWTGAVAANEIGEVLGIVSQTGSGESQIVSVATVRGALERVKRLRGSAPQPWIGIGGGAAFKEPLEAWREFGWTPEAALSHIQSGSGVFLTKVARGAPAALAGLKPGDLISRIGARDVRGVEDLSLTLKEAGVGSSLDFTVWRALEPEPLKFTIRLAAAHDLGLAFEEAEARAATAAGVNAAVAPAAARALEMAKSLKTFGLDSLRLTPRSAARLGARGGLLVVAVRPGSSAADCGLRAGDVIETANGIDFTLQELRRMLANRAAEPVSLGVVRGGARTNVNLKPSEGSEP
jgi:S1-C subfamily serine protease